LPNNDDGSSRSDLQTRLIAIGLVNGKPQKEQVRLLSIAGMAPKEIADLIGTTPNTVNVTLSSLLKNGKMNLKTEGEKEDV
jgi:DNA-directed RNA polymerase specialized sigma24 family protein